MVAAGPAAVAIVAAFIYWALKTLRKLPTTQVALMFIVGCGLTLLVGVWVVTAFGWAAQAASGLPASWRQAVMFIPAGFAAAGTIFVLVALHPKERPHEKAAHFALVLPLLALLVAGGLWGTNAKTIVHNTNQATTQVLGTFFQPKGK